MNPYESPGGGGPEAISDPQRRGAFVLAAIGAGLASLYWAGYTAWIGLVLAANPGSGLSTASIILPCVLIGLYALRAFQIAKGDASAARSVLWLHGVGGALAAFQILSSPPLFAVVNGIKVAIHLFGGITAYRATKV